MVRNDVGGGSGGGSGGWLASPPTRDKGRPFFVFMFFFY